MNSNGTFVLLVSPADRNSFRLLTHVEGKLDQHRIKHILYNTKIVLKNEENVSKDPPPQANNILSLQKTFHPSIFELLSTFIAIFDGSSCNNGIDNFSIFFTTLNNLLFLLKAPLFIFNSSLWKYLILMGDNRNNSWNPAIKCQIFIADPQNNLSPNFTKRYFTDFQIKTRRSFK